MKSEEYNVTVIQCCGPEREKHGDKSIKPQLKEFMTAVIRLVALALSSIGAAYLLGLAH